MSLSPTPNWYQRIVLLIKKMEIKKKKKPSPQQPNMAPSLSNDLLLTCFALISRLYYPTLSLVSKSFQSLIASPELYEIRSLLGRTESCLYVCLRFPPDPNPRWYTLCMKPDHTGKKKKKKNTKKDEKSSGRLLVPISIKNAPPSECSNLVAVGPYIYAISGSTKNDSCSNVPFLDCRTHTWLEAPKLRVAHTNRYFERTLYLPGECKDPDSLNCIEVYDAERKTWKPVPPERRETKFKSMEGKMILHASTGNHIGLAFIPKESSYEELGTNTGSDLFRICCIIHNISYYYSYENGGEFVWVEENLRRIVKGLEGLPKISSDYRNVKLVRHGENMLVLWDESVGRKERKVWCAELSFERRSTEEMWGKVEWFGVVLTVPKSYVFMSAISATV
ncbi:unnamed protein product [Microthlaspi erraticum]|uniref:Uncharacterized protein n=1 Tax=Microthlaspi erraticum TaxID=1685480 RepID=A0A6D2KT52_9BRAS|nr:unnamed protein product [Microthlaspi erraticum]